jgi:hypothetical protein
VFSQQFQQFVAARGTAIVKGSSVDTIFENYIRSPQTDTTSNKQRLITGIEKVRSQTFFFFFV